MRVFHAPAKINLLLRVIAREATGWHQIESVLCRLELADEVAIEPGHAGLELESEGDDVGPPRANLVWRAASAFFEMLGEAPAARIRLTKRIPAGAGLGGGSSDAASTLLGLNTLHDGPLSQARLLDIGAAIGSDVPFFLAGGACALVWGRGERVLPLPSPPPVPVVLAVPPQRVATADAYSRLAVRRQSAPQRSAPFVLEGLRNPTWARLDRLAGNDFEPVIDVFVPVVAMLRAVLQDGGARIAQLTGSGSAVFGVFDEDAAARAAAAALSTAVPDARVIVTRTEAGPG